MKHEEILASVAVLALSGVLVYLTRVGLLTIGGANARNNRISSNQAIASDDIAGAGGDPMSLISGPQIWLANVPWPFGANVGNVIPPTSGALTLPGASTGDFLGFVAV